MFAAGGGWQRWRAGTVGAVLDDLADLHGAYDFVESAVAPEAILSAMSAATAASA